MVKRARKPVGHGGLREGAGRKSLFPGKRHKITVTMTNVGRAAVRSIIDQLTTRKPRIGTADDIDAVTFSDAVEYLVRKASGTPLDD